VDSPVFLTAEWKNLAMLNYPVDPSLLMPMLPAGTELDSWNGTTFVSMVGLYFENTRVRGIPVPLHRNFEEVNLRFYVRRKSGDVWRRGVVFIKEIVPRMMIAISAQAIYNEPYISLPMSHRFEQQRGELQSVSYSWRLNNEQQSLTVRLRGQPQVLPEGSEAEFITEHYWGYNKQTKDSTLEYQVEHPRWRIHDVVESRLDCDVSELYGRPFAEYLTAAPSSAFLAEGSPIVVRQGVKL
jgi:uncharacterized protein YqjF (DUF2071 family)